MDQLKDALVAAFDAAEMYQDPRQNKVKLALQQAAAYAGFTDLAFELRGRIAGGMSVKSEGVRPKANRFSTVPPAQEVFVNPNLSAARTNAERAASEDDEKEEEAAAAEGAETNADGAESVYDRIAKLSPNAIVSQYGESGIEGMIVAKGGDLKEVDGKKPNQKAAYLKSLCAPAE